MTQHRGVRIVLQLVGFAIGLALLTWAITMALDEENRRQLENLRIAAPGAAVWVIALSGATLVLNGLAFWVVLAPVKRLRIADIQAVNAVASLLAYLPFKLSALTRVVIHNRRDRVPVLTIGAWFLALGATMAAGIGPLLLASVLRQRINAVWLVVSGVGVAACAGVTIVCARYFGAACGMARLQRLIDPLTPKRWRHLARSRRFGELHQGFAMLASGRAVALAVAIRLADVVVQGARFGACAAILGIDLSFSQAVLLALSYFLIGVVSPSGVLGMREMGTTAVAAIAGVADPDAFVGVALLVTASESIAYIAGAAIGLAWLRPRRLLSARQATTMIGDEAGPGADQSDHRGYARQSAEDP